MRIYTHVNMEDLTATVSKVGHIVAISLVKVGQKLGKTEINSVKIKKSDTIKASDQAF